MIKMNEEVYLQNLVFKKTHDDKGCVMGNIIFKNSISLEEYTNIQEKKDLILCDKSQNNWNELKKWLEEYKENTKIQYQGSHPTRQYSLEIINAVLRVTIEKMQELEGNDAK